MRFPCFFAFAVLYASSAAAQSIALFRLNAPTPRGEWREETRMEVNGISLKIGSGGQSLGGEGSFTFLESVSREFTRSDRQETQVMNSSTQGSLALLGNAAQDFAAGGPLLGKKLLGQRTQNAWKFVFKDVKPSPEEQKALEAFGKRSDALAFWPHLYGTQPRRVGETWKADTGALEKDKKPDSPLTAEIQLTLAEVADHNGTRCARIEVNGFFKVTFGANNAGTLKFDVQGTIWRDVRELVDVDTSLRGSFSVTGAPVNNPNAPAGTTVELSAPFTLTRTVQPAKR